LQSTQKKFRSLSVQPGLSDSNDLIVVLKWRTFNCFSVQGTGGSPTGPDPVNRIDDQEFGSPGMPVSSGLQVPVSRDIVVQEQDPLVELPAVIFLQNFLQLNQQG